MAVHHSTDWVTLAAPWVSHHNSEKTRLGQWRTGYDEYICSGCGAHFTFRDFMDFRILRDVCRCLPTWWPK